MGTKTKYFILIIIVLIAVFDGYAIIKGGTESSISHTLIVWSYQYPILTFLFGVVVGHLFWRMSDTQKTSEISEETRN